MGLEVMTAPRSQEQPPERRYSFEGMTLREMRAVEIALLSGTRGALAQEFLERLQRNIDYAVELEPHD